MESIEYFRGREQAEREAVRGASCEEARWAHEQLAQAYARLIELEELKACGSLSAGKVINVADALRARGDSEYGRHRAAPAATRLPASAGRARP